MATEADRLEERVLVLRCQLGDQQAFAALVRRYHDRLVWSLRRLVPEHAVDDLLRETWTSVFRKLPQLRSAAAFPRRLHRLARNHAFAALRVPSPRAAAEWPAAEPVAPAAPDAPDLEALHRASGGPAVGPPPSARAALPRRAELRGIAAEIGRPIGTVRSRLHHAMQGLRRRMESERGR